MLPTKSTIDGDEAVEGRRVAAGEEKANQF
jgi:hypothetical protein